MKIIVQIAALALTIIQATSQHNAYASTVLQPADTQEVMADTQESNPVAVDIREATIRVSRVLRPIDDLLDQSTRDANAKLALPALSELERLLAKDESNRDAQLRRIETLGMMVFLGDPKAEDFLKTIHTDSNDKELALRAELSRLTALVRRSSSDMQQQAKLVAQLEVIARKELLSNSVFHCMDQLIKDGSTETAIKYRLKQVIFNDCFSDDALVWKIKLQDESEVTLNGITTDGKSIDLKQYRGKIVVLMFWATWCPYCTKELPQVLAIEKSNKDNGVVFIGILTDDTPVNLEKFQKSNGYPNWPTIVRPREQSAKDFGLLTIPGICILNQDGRISARLDDYPPEDLEKIISQQVSQKGQ